MRIFGFTRHGGPEVASFMDVPEPVAGPGQVLIEMLATSVNPGDLSTREGRNTFEVIFPMAMGREAAGRVLALGEGVDHVAEGGLVFGSAASGHGSFGEQVLLDAASTTPIPDGLDVISATCIPVAYATAYDVLDHLGLARGQTMVVIGAGGGVGTAITPLARARGIQVVGVASARKHDLVTRLGAIHVESGAGWVDRVRAVVGKPDALFDLVGGEVLAEGAELIHDPDALISVADPGQAGELGGSGIERRRTRQIYGQVARILAEGQAEVTIGRVLPFTDAEHAVAIVEDGHAEGKIALTAHS